MHFHVNCWFRGAEINPVVAQFTPALFWDVDRNEIDLEKHRKFIVKRVLERGLDNDWRLLKSCYSLADIVAAAKSLRSLEPKALAFIACLGGLQKDEFRCYHEWTLIDTNVLGWM